MPSLSQLLASLVEQRISEKNVSKSEVCRKTGITRPTLDRYIEGRIGLKAIERLMGFLGIQPWEIGRAASATSEKSAFLAEIAAKTADFSDSEKRYLLNAIESVKSLRPAASLQKVEKKER